MVVCRFFLLLDITENIIYQKNVCHFNLKFFRVARFTFVLKLQATYAVRLEEPFAIYHMTLTYKVNSY